MSFAIGVVAFVVAAIIVFGGLRLALGRIERTGVIVEQFDYIIQNDTYENEQHNTREFLGMRLCEPEDEIVAHVTTRLSAYVVKRGDYYNLIWTDRYGRPHLWRGKTYMVYETDCYSVREVRRRAEDFHADFAFDWEIGNGPTPARK